MQQPAEFKLLLASHKIQRDPQLYYISFEIRHLLIFLWTEVSLLSIKLSMHLMITETKLCKTKITKLKLKEL